MSEKQSNNIWAFKSVSDEERSYISIGGYNDDISSRYEYDSNVANCKQVKQGDVAVLVDKEHILGFAKITDIQSGSSIKTIRKCPDCGSTNFEPRKNKVPLYRCNRGHEFEEERVIVTEQQVTTYKSVYNNSFIRSSGKIDISLLRPYYHKGYNRNMSIQSLNAKLLSDLFPDILIHLSRTPSYLQPTEAEETVAKEDLGDYSPDENDERELIQRQIRARRGQAKFRNELRQRYGDICMVSGCEILDIIEAAHINPYRGIKDNDVRNGLLLRSDIHTLFDLNLIGIEPETLLVYVHESVRSNGYDKFHLTPLLCKNPLQTPSKEALLIRWQSFHMHT